MGLCIGTAFALAEVGEPAMAKSPVNSRAASTHSAGEGLLVPAHEPSSVTASSSLGGEDERLFGVNLDVLYRDVWRCEPVGFFL
jgi:hypothetical protein